MLVKYAATFITHRVIQLLLIHHKHTLNYTLDQNGARCFIGYTIRFLFIVHFALDQPFLLVFTPKDQLLGVISDICHS
jgi:hypothetical protein